MVHNARCPAQAAAAAISNATFSLVLHSTWTPAGCISSRLASAPVDGVPG